VILEWNRGCFRIMIHAELMLIVRAIKRHLDLLRVLGV
jgi:hypothetical protein